MLRKKKTESYPLLRVWTGRYLLMLISGLFVIALLLGIWVRSNVYEQSYQLLTVRAEQISETYQRLAEEDKSIPINLYHSLQAIRSRQFICQVVNASGNVDIAIGIQPVPPDLLKVPPTYQEVLAGQVTREVTQINGQNWQRVGVPIFENQQITKVLYLSAPAKGTLQEMQRQFTLLGIFTAGIGLVGWLVIYFLSRRLTQPLRELAEAAREVAEGQYHPVLPDENMKEEELRQLVISFAYMASRLEQLERLRIDLLAGVSHELRTPITSIRGMIQAVQGRVVTGEEAAEFLEISLGEAVRLQGMVEDLLSFSSLEAGAVQVERQPVELTRIIKGIISQIKSLDEFLGLALNMHLRLEEGEIWVLGDADKLRQILMNLLTNSREAGANNITITLTPREEQNKIFIDVQDDGKGIPENQQSYIFERYYRGKKERAKTHGLGLGLPLSRLLARALGGDLQLLHTSESGTVFRLELSL
ncbi:HAMP domain-containing sensor histidine kinase [Aneurinibacillus sp. Ricciae_BoGa-3]|uniref:sensor histidine kinase n=1 Tax=Aneurinibacillus sp. Ricciae_BoGa-3 TaxID=3022697 RepID=UPI0023417B3A|nr:HAMP domain-containing sensor histidine kinase [Aneurinibacillus sp. Ricciae_BoGa-3]WCK54156.1 HAMP domain-containing sensor histidine kinase [Aneurinibacillus sp. Ricciae_BoGa-3]